MESLALYELNRLVKLVAASTEGEANPDEVLELAKVLLKRSNLLTEPGFYHEYKDVLSPISVLASEVFATNRNNAISRDAFASISSASQLLVTFMVSNVDADNARKFLNPLSALCTGSACLESKEKAEAIESLKSSIAFPPGLVFDQSQRPQRPPMPLALQQQANENEGPSDFTRPQTDLTSALILQLRSTFENSLKFEAGQAGGASSSSSTGFEDELHSFSTRNVQCMRNLNASDKLIDICLNLPQLRKHIANIGQWENAMDLDPSSIRDVQIGDLLQDVDIAWKSLSLPILEPLTSERLVKITQIVMGCLVSSVSVASIEVGDSTEAESMAVEIVENSLELFNTVLNTIRQSTRAGGHILQNYVLMGAWVLTSGLLLQLASASKEGETHLDATRDVQSMKHLSIGDKPEGINSKQPRLSDLAKLMSHGLNLNKVGQRFNVLSVALASEALTLTSLLLEDLASEEKCLKLDDEPATLDLFQPFTASQRVALVLNSVPLIPLLFNVAFVSFRKGLTSKSEPALYDSSKPNDQDDDNEEDEDSEPLLGKWFEETLSLFPSEASSSTTDKKAKKGSENLSKVEPSGFYISLASHIFIFLNKHMLTASEDTFLSTYIKNGLSEAQMIVLADMIRDIDGLERTYAEFTNALASFTYDMLALGLLTHKLQNDLLAQLGVSPWHEDEFWPLQVQPRTLSILAHILILRQASSEQDFTSRPNVYASIWQRVLSSLTEAIMEDDSETSEDSNDNDLNVEHAQLLLFLFHALALMQKKQLLLYAGNCLIKVAKVRKSTQRQILHSSRLILIFEYMMKNLYEPPKSLMSQVQHNIFKRQANDEIIFHPCYEVNKANGHKFYNLFEVQSGFTAEVPKLDGLALSFVLGTSESLKYAQLYQALIENLDVVKSVGILSSSEAKLKPGFLAAVQYCFALTMRTLQAIPPSVEFLETLSGAPYLNENGEADTCALLHSLIICHRLNEKHYSGWVKDSLVKQGQTTAKAESLLKNVTSTVSTFSYDLRMLKQLLRSSSGIALAKRGQLVAKEKLATFFDLVVLDATTVQLHMAVDKTRSTSDVNLKQTIESACEVILPLLETLSAHAKSAIVHGVNMTTKRTDEEVVVDDHAKQMMLQFLSISGTRCSQTDSLAMTLEEHCPSGLRSALAAWQDGSLAGFATLEESRSSSMNPEVFLYNRIHCHLSSLSCPLMSLKQNLYSVARFAKDLCIWAPENITNVQNDIAYALFPLITDSCTEILSNLLALVLEKQIGSHESDEFAAKVFQHVLQNTFEALIKPVNFDERILIEIVHYMEEMLDRPIGRATLDQFFSDAPYDLDQLLLSMSRQDLSPEFASRVLKFFNKLFSVHEKNPTEEATERLCASLSSVAYIPTPQLEAWLSHVVKGFYDSSSKDDSSSVVEENCHLLHCLTNFIVEANSTVPEEVSLTILACLIPMASEILAENSKQAHMFQDLMMVLTTLASAGSGLGHIQLFRSCSEWMQKHCRGYLSKMAVQDENAMETSDDVMVVNACKILEYMSDVIAALKLTNNEQDEGSSKLRSSSPSGNDNTDNQADNETDWMDELNNDEDDSAAEDSDDEGLNSRLCTFTQTQKEFMNQHWYHCHTCKMVDGVGVCTICAKVCHASHDVTYSKHGSFFCDCGAKEDGSCIALTKREQSSSAMMSNGTRPSMTSTASNIGYELTSSLRRRASSPVIVGLNNLNGTEEKTPLNDKDMSRMKLAKKVNGWKEVFLDEIRHSCVASNLLEMLKTMVPVVKANGVKNSMSGRSANLRSALMSLHAELPTERSCEFSDQLMLPTLGSQEGAFENVRMSYSGDHGQIIRGLMNSHMVRRVVMCCLSSGKRQHLAVAHEKGKLTVLQLSALLKQADSSQKKLTLTRLASAPVPFTVLSIVSNPCNEDYLVVTGIKDCHVLTFSPSGSVVDHLVLHPQLDANNFIIKAVWMPGSQTELALITAKFVKVYDLGKDVLSPQYFLLVPSGTVRDCTLAFMADGLRYVLIMSSGGHIHFQALTQEASAVNGPFYVTNTMDVDHPALRETSSEQVGRGGVSGDQLGGGGVSIYYSQVLQVLFISYVQGLSFMASMRSIEEDSLRKSVTQIHVQKSATSSNKNNGGQFQPLCQWGEVAGHPGLILAFLQASNNPVVIMVKPEIVVVQEIKIGSKAKIVDMVAIRHHSSSNNQDKRTTLILLCEDGSLKIYMAGIEATGFWLSPRLNPSSSLFLLAKPPRKKRPMITKNKGQGALSFPVDFFEHCNIINDIEFGGTDVLQVYNVQQVKHRLQTAACYIANTKPAGFNLEVTNNDNALVIVGVRVMLGGVDTGRTPSFIEIHGRNLMVNLNRSRWFDFPLSREESLMSDKKLVITFGPSFDPGGVNIVDSVQVYGKTKEAFGWPEDNEECSSSGIAALASSSSTSQNPDALTSADNLALTTSGPLDRVMSVILEILEGCFTIEASPNNLDDHKAIALEISTQILTIPAAINIATNNKALLSTLFPSKCAYHGHKDQTLLQNATEQSDKMDVEKFEKLILDVRSVAVSRPTNLTKFAETNYKTSVDFVDQLAKWFWSLLKSCPVNAKVGTLGQPGLNHVEAIVQALVEIFHAFTSVDLATVPQVSNLYAQFLVAESLQVSFAAKQAIIRVLRPKLRRKRVFIPSPPPGEVTTSGTSGLVVPSLEAARPQANPAVVAESEAMEIDHELLEDAEGGARGGRGLGLGPGGIHLGGIAGNLDALLGGVGQNPDMVGEIDDEAMVELAIALSLQEQGEGVDLANLQHGLQGLQQGLQQLANLGPGLQGFPALQGLAGMLGRGHHHEEEEEDAAIVVNPDVPQAQNPDQANYSDATASAPGSDDDDEDEDEEEEEEEGSTAALDGSAIRTPPVEVEPMHSLPPGGSGSESGASANESIVGEQTISGRSSAYEADNGGPSASTRLVEADAKTTQEATEWEATNIKLHSLRMNLLDQLVVFLPTLRDIGGPRCIPFMQVVLMLTTDLDGNDERDCSSFDQLLTALINELDIGKPEANLDQRSSKREFQLVVLRLFSVLMSRSKSWQQSGLRTNINSAFVSKVTASALVKAGCTQHCLSLLTHMLPFWRSKVTEENLVKVFSSTLLKSQPEVHTPPDMSPFFLKPYVKSHSHDVFEAYPQLLTEMVLKLPYQYFKIIESDLEAVRMNSNWQMILCEYMMMIHQTTPYVRRQVRKLMLFICGTKESYRELRDLHALDTHMKKIMEIINDDIINVDPMHDTKTNLPYDTLLLLIEHLKACVEISSSRTGNWQKFCTKNRTILPFLFRVSFKLDDGVNPIILQLLQNAICVNHQGLSASTSSQQLSRKRAWSPRKGQQQSATKAIMEEEDNNHLIHTLGTQLTPLLIRNFVEKFLLECNTSSVRWQAHSLIVTLQLSSSSAMQSSILDVLWSLWPQLPLHGRKAAQFVDVLGYFSLKISSQDETKVQTFVHEAVNVLKSQNKILASHPNSNIYGSLSQLVEFNGYYLESDPCLVCNNPEVPYSSFKLSTLKVDTKYTTTTHIVKLSTSHSISKIALRIGDLKRQKMVRTINIYYNNRSVQAVVELKNRPTMWHKARKVSLTAGQTEIKIEFPLPIVACNFMIEYADFYENIQASSETLQCPRCSASVPANPGVCSNCGENVFQCHKCRSINYDEKDPFLCNACGFCKYAKFEYTLTSRPTCAVDPIESEEDRKKAILNINSLLDKADRVYRQLIGNKPVLESLLLRISESGISEIPDSLMSSFSASNGIHVNQWIQQLAQKYCGDCKNSFEELSKIIQKVMATRRELVAFDRKKSSLSESSSRSLNEGQSLRARCYGCAAASVEHCLTLLRALATKAVPRNELYQEGLIQELMEFNLRRGTPVVRHEVRKLICLLTKDNQEATNHLNKLLLDKIGMALRGHSSYPDLVESVRHEMTLLGVTVQREDSCWEQRLRCVLKIFIAATREGNNKNSPTVVEYVTLPCLKILHGLMRNSSVAGLVATSTKKDVNESMTLVPYEANGLQMDKWLSEEESYDDWQKKAMRYVLKKPSTEMKKRANCRLVFLQEKYFRRWHERSILKGSKMLMTISSPSWLKRVLFNPSSRMAREVACQMVENFCTKDFNRKKAIVEMLTTFLSEVAEAGEAGQEFASLYQRMIMDDQWKFYLAVKGILSTLAQLIMSEIDNLDKLEHLSLSSDLAQGFALKTMTDIFASFLAKDSIKRVFKGRLLSTVLHGYLSLRRLVVQRTKLVDQTQEKLLELLEDMTSGTVEETKNFMAICVETINRYPVDDQLTPVFIFERLCNIIYPEEADMGEFFMTLEKDPQQEDFLQGRMLGNPYSSNDPDLGPNMREIKNKICTDCELIALLEDDNGMELLVNNKIISLDLPVKDVYQKIWLPVAQENEPMRIIYRMRGLLGDATEEFIETLSNKDAEDQDEEEMYKMSSVMSSNGGLEVILNRLANVQDTVQSRQLLIVLLKLLGYCVKVRTNRERLLEPSLKTIPILLNSLKLCLKNNPGGEANSVQGPSLCEQVLGIMEKLLVEASSHKSGEEYGNIASNSTKNEDIQELLEHAVNLKAGTALHHGLLRFLPFLTYANNEKMALVINFFDDVLDFSSFNDKHLDVEMAKMEAFVSLCEGIERNDIGSTMKIQMHAMNIIGKCLKYLTDNAPTMETAVMKADDPFWKEFVSKPALKYVLRALAGLATQHSPTQMALSKEAECIPILHQMEQVSSDEHVGSLAEAVLESLKGHPEAEARVKAVRDHTKAEKKRLAMAMRAKQLKAFGLKANDQGQVKADNNILQQFVGIAEESGLCCNICREGYKFQPNKVLAIYTFTKACNVDDGEVIELGRKTTGYSTVTHFNLVHVDCHMAALRLQRGRDEWESAILQNANTKCNGLLPLWGPQVAESSFASCLARHNTYLYEATRHRDIGYQSTVHDLKLLLLRFAQDKSFSSESGGGGPQSNMNLVPYLIHMGLYVLNTTRAAPREEKNLVAFLEMPKDKWLESSYAADGAFYYASLALLLFSPARWRRHRVAFLQRLLLLAHARCVSPLQRCQRLHDKSVKDYGVYKLVILYFALVDQLYEHLFSQVVIGSGNESEWPAVVADWIRHNDDVILKASAKVLTTFQEDLQPANSVDEIIDVCGLLDEIPSPANFLAEILANLS